MNSLDTIKDIFDMSLIDDMKFVAPPGHTCWIAFSSFFFLIPSAYAFCNQLYFMSAVLFFTSFTSFNFWRKPNYSWRRIADRIYAKIAFLVVFLMVFVFIILTLLFILPGSHLSYLSIFIICLINGATIPFVTI